MQLLEALILGLVQGLTEFIPVSSSGHLVITNELFNFSVGGFYFDVLLNIGTILALVIYFREDLKRIFTEVFSQKNYKLTCNVVIATIPAVIAGFFLQDLAETSFRSPWVVVSTLISVGIIMLFADRVSKNKKFAQFNPKSSLGVGLAQALAIIPGTSRSGITISAAALMGYKNKAAAHFSFLIAIPVLSGAVVKVLFSSEGINFVQNNLAVMAVGVSAAFISGYLAVRFMLNYLGKHGLSLFAWYRIVLGAVLLLII